MPRLHKNSGGRWPTVAAASEKFMLERKDWTPDPERRSLTSRSVLPPEIGFLTNGAKKRDSPCKTGLPYRLYQGRTNGPSTRRGAPVPRLCV